MVNNAFQKPSLKRAHFQRTTLLVPDIPQDYRVVCAFTERSGGVSAAPYDSLNLGTHVQDDLGDVAENRLRLFDDLNLPKEVTHLITPNQVHGTDVLVVDKTADLSTYSTDRLRGWDVVIPSCDAVVSNRTDIAALLCFADCVPVLMCAPGAFAVIHSGWRGTVGHISAQALTSLRELSGADLTDIYAFIGPAIGPESYQVSLKLAETFRETWPHEDLRYAGKQEGYPHHAGHLVVVRDDNHLDLRAAITRDLIATGLPYANIVVSDICTAQNTDRFFSYRASGGVCGRHGAVAFLRE